MKQIKADGFYTQTRDAVNGSPLISTEELWKLRRDALKLNQTKLQAAELQMGHILTAHHVLRLYPNESHSAA